MITVIKPIIFAFLKTNAVKELVVKLLEAYAKNTDMYVLCQDIVPIVKVKPPKKEKKFKLF